jgi:hypothetical protein
MSRFSRRFNRHAVPHQNREHGIEARLRRGNLLTEPFVVRRQFGREHEAMGQEINIAVKVERQSWMMPITAGVLNGERIVPQSGDRLEVDGEVWEIHAPDNGTPPTEKQTGGYYWIVHTRLKPNG